MNKESLFARPPAATKYCAVGDFLIGFFLLDVYSIMDVIHSL